MKEPILVDPFDTAVFGTETGVNVRLDGIAPFARLYINNHCSTDQPQSKVVYNADVGYDLKNGDSITVSASLSGTAEQEGYTLTRTETILQVAGPDSYITDVSQIQSADFDNLRSKLEDYFLNSIVSNRISFRPEGSNYASYSGIDVYPNDSTISNFGFDWNGWTRVDDHDDACTLVPFHFDLEQRNVYWVGRQHYDPSITVNYSLHGLYKISDMTSNGDTGNVNSGTFRIELVDCYEVEDELHEYIDYCYAPDIAIEGTFVKQDS